jgi:hypothetical protein
VPNLEPCLILDRCPHCSVSNPNLISQIQFETHNHRKKNRRVWGAYVCMKCGGVVIASSTNPNHPVIEYFAKSKVVDDDVPERPRAFLKQALDSLHAPAGAVMLTASAVDSMLKLKNYSDGSLYSRIEVAVKDHLLTPEMAAWAHEVRLDANDQRHADSASILPEEMDAKRTIDFALALAEILFVLPSRVRRGITPEKENG